MSYLLRPLIIGVLAALMQLLAVLSPNQGHPEKLTFLSWIGFAAWACYFLAGGTIKGGIKVTSCWLAGVIASVGIVALGCFLSNKGLGTAAFPIAVGVVAFGVFCFEKVPALDMIPAWFVGAACFFGLNPGQDVMVNVNLGITTMIACLIAQVFGYVTVHLLMTHAKMFPAPAAK